MALVRAVGEEAIALASNLLYQPTGLGTKDKGEWADQYAGEAFMVNGLMQKMAGALEAAEAYIAKSRQLGGLGQAAMTAVGTTISVVSKVTSLIKGISSSKLDERRADNSKAGLKRMKERQLVPAEAAYTQLTGALMARGIPFSDRASDVYFAQLKERLGGWPEWPKRAFSKRPFRDPVDRFVALMATTASEVNAIPIAQQSLVPAQQLTTGPVDSNVAPAAVEAPEEKGGNWLLPAGAALLALKIFGG